MVRNRSRLRFHDERIRPSRLRSLNTPQNQRFSRIRLSHRRKSPRAPMPRRHHRTIRSTRVRSQTRILPSTRKHRKQTPQRKQTPSYGGARQPLYLRRTAHARRREREIPLVECYLFSIATLFANDAHPQDFPKANPLHLHHELKLMYGNILQRCKITTLKETKYVRRSTTIVWFRTNPTLRRRHHRTFLWLCNVRQQTTK